MKQVYEVSDATGSVGKRGEIYTFTDRQKAIEKAQKIANVTLEPEYVEICDMREDGEYEWGANDIRVLPNFQEPADFSGATNGDR